MQLMNTVGSICKLVEYDVKNPKSIEDYAKKLIGKKFSDISNETSRTSNEKAKGGLGQFVEEEYFHYECNSNPTPDFEEAGVELKVTPYKKNSSGRTSAKERLVITMIDYNEVVEESFENSHVWNKGKLMLLIYYLYDSEIKNRLDYRIDYVTLFTPPDEDIEIIKQDFETIVNKVKAGKAHELSEGDTLYLGACTKSSDSSKRRSQPFSDELAKPRAFAFKNSYMTYVLNNYIIKSSQTYESIVTGKINMPFEKYVVQQISRFEGCSQRQLCNEFGIALERVPKNLGAMLAYRMLGIKGNTAEEFVKANIIVKTIRINKHGSIKESMSFPTFKFKELAEETEWEDSQIYNYLSDKRFLFVVYKENNEGEMILKGCQFWNIPYFDLNANVQLTWERTKLVIKEGIKVEYVNGVRRNNFPTQKDNPVCHVRPHGRDANDVDELPDGSSFTKQCFWLNNTYIKSQLNDIFFE